SWSGKSPRPWLHIAEVVATEAKEAGYRRLGVLGTRILMDGPVYPSCLERADLEYDLPDPGETTTHQRDHLPGTGQGRPENRVPRRGESHHRAAPREGMRRRDSRLHGATPAHRTVRLAPADLGLDTSSGEGRVAEGCQGDGGLRLIVEG